MKEFLLVVITRPECFDGEADLLEGLLDAGAARLHIRKPTSAGVETERLVEALAARWADRLVLHGERATTLASRHGISQIHGPASLVRQANCAVSTSVHNWNEMRSLPEGLSYAFISPLFDSISKPGYTGKSELSKGLSGPRPCKVIGLGGIAETNIMTVLKEGWDGAAVLGYLWQRPEKAVERFELLQKIAAIHGKQTAGY